MQFSITSTAATQQLVKNLQSASNIMTKSKVQALKTAALIMQAKAKEEAPTASTNLRKNIKYEVDNDGEKATVFVDENIEYARFQEEGTGIHGPKHSFIYPKRAKMLAWRSKAGEMIFARRSSGSRPKWYMKKGMEELSRSWNKVNQVLYDSIKKGLGI